MERNVHFVELADDYNVLSACGALRMKHLMQIDNGDKLVSGDKHTLNLFGGIGHRCDLTVYHDLADLCNIYSVCI